MNGERYMPTGAELEGVNCLVAALAVLMQRRPADIRAAIEAAAPVGESAFSDDGGCRLAVWQSWLASLGWRKHERAAPDWLMPIMPRVCMVEVCGHVFAAIDGMLLDDVPPTAYGHQVDAFWEPPADHPYFRTLRGRQT